MIPKVIHYCWFGRSPKSALTERCLATWREWMPEYTLKEWNEDNSPMDIPYLREASRHRLWSKVSNYVRHHALWTEGGVYLDTDVQIIRSLAPLSQHQVFLGFQSKEMQADWVNDAVMGAVAGHTLNRTCLELTAAGPSEESRYYRSPVIMTRALTGLGLRDYGRQDLGGVALYPVESFYPYSWNEAFEESCIKPETFCVHHWSGSWCEEFGRYHQKTRLRRGWKRLLRLLAQRTGRP